MFNLHVPIWHFDILRRDGSVHKVCEIRLVLPVSKILLDLVVSLVSWLDLVLHELLKAGWVKFKFGRDILLLKPKLPWGINIVFNVLLKIACKLDVIHTLPDALLLQVLFISILLSLRLRNNFISQRCHLLQGWKWSWITILLEAPFGNHLLCTDGMVSSMGYSDWHLSLRPHEFRLLHDYRIVFSIWYVLHGLSHADLHWLLSKLIGRIFMLSLLKHIWLLSNARGVWCHPFYGGYGGAAVGWNCLVSVWDMLHILDFKRDVIFTFAFRIFLFLDSWNLNFDALPNILVLSRAIWKICMSFSAFPDLHLLYDVPFHQRYVCLVGSFVLWEHKRSWAWNFVLQVLIVSKAIFGAEV